MARFGEDETGEVEVNGRPLECVVCRHHRFLHRRGMLNTPGLTFLNLDWANRTADLYICDACGYIHWFLEG